MAAIRGRRGEQRKCVNADNFDAFVRTHTQGALGWAAALDTDVLYWLCWLDTEGAGNTVVHTPHCPGVGDGTRDQCPEGDPCPKRYAYASLDKGQISKLRITYQDQLGRPDEWNPITLRGNQVSGALIKVHLKFAREEQRQVGVTTKQAQILMSLQLGKLVSHMRRTARSRKTMGERISITRDILPCSAWPFTRAEGGLIYRVRRGRRR